MKTTPSSRSVALIRWALALALLPTSAATAQEASTPATPAITGDQAKALETATEKLAEADTVLRQHKLAGRLVNGTLKIEVPFTAEAARAATQWPQAGLQGIYAERIGNHLEETATPGGVFGRPFEVLARRCEQLERENAELNTRLESARKNIADLLAALKACEEKTTPTVK